MRPLTSLLPALALLAGCGGSGEVCPQPAAKVRARMAAIDEVPVVFGSIPVTMTSSRRGDGTIVWRVSQGDRSILRFLAHSEAVDNGSTRVRVEVTGPTDRPDDPVTQRLADNASVRDLYQLAMAEQIDATLENREFDFSRIAAATTRAVAANIGEISANMDKVGEESRRRGAENIARAYHEEAQGY